MNTGLTILTLVQQVETHVCTEPDCHHIGQPCGKCKLPVCRSEHGEVCEYCGEVFHFGCFGMHPTYCDQAPSLEEMEWKR